MATALGTPTMGTNGWRFQVILDRLDYETIYALGELRSEKTNSAVVREAIYVYRELLESRPRLAARFLTQAIQRRKRGA